MAQHAPVVPQPTGPQWSALSLALRSDCITAEVTPAATFQYKSIRRTNGTLSPHTFCPISARCSVPLYLAGIAGFNNTVTIFLSNHAFLRNNRFCFGHINIPEDEWRHKRFHVRFYKRVSGQPYMLEEAAIYRGQAQLQRFLTGPRKNQRFWIVQDDHAYAPPTHELREVAQVFTVPFEQFLTQHFA